MRLAFVREGARQLYASGGEDFLAPATALSVGFDLRACLDAPVVEIAPGGRFCVPTGISVQPCLPGVAGFVYSRSGLGARDGLTVAQGVGVIDADYRGELVVWLLNTSEVPLTVARGDRVAQLVFQPVRRLEPKPAASLSDTERGSGGFGHTGRR